MFILISFLTPIFFQLPINKGCLELFDDNVHGHNAGSIAPFGKILFDSCLAASRDSITRYLHHLSSGTFESVLQCKAVIHVREILIIFNVWIDSWNDKLFNQFRSCNVIYNKECLKIYNIV